MKIAPKQNIFRSLLTERFFWVWSILVVVTYLLTHLLSLTTLPIFADEAIYIRWTQLMIDDWQRYAFFPLNDGKTPLQFWLLIPWQFLPLNQLASARLFMVFVGLLQILASAWLAKLFGAKRFGQLSAMVLSAFLPYWFFHHSLFLLDGLLALWITLTFGCGLKLVQGISSEDRLSQKSFVAHARLIVLTGLAFGAALLTKVPAILVAPSIGLLVFYQTKNAQHALKKAVFLLIAAAVGLSCFLMLALTPVFGQLFARGSDFLFPWQTVLLDGAWQETLPSFPNYAFTFLIYLTPAVFILNVVSLFTRKEQSRSHLLFWAGVIFLFPMMLLGRVVYPRYLFPASVFFTISASLFLEQLVEWIRRKPLSVTSASVSVTLAILLANSAQISSQFIWTSMTDSASLPLVRADRDQYLLTWSSGHGIEESVAYIQEIAATKKVAVATEGSFGTLPDGLLVYFHRQDVQNIFIDGIGYPVKSISNDFISKTANFDQYLLIGNSDRIKDSDIPLDKLKLLQQYCRPEPTASCLQIWDFTQYYSELSGSTTSK